MKSCNKIRSTKESIHIVYFCPSFSSYLRVNLEVILLSRLLVARVRVWDSGLASWDGVGEAGGATEGGLRSLICPPWKVLLTVEPRERRAVGVEAEEDTPEAPAMLWLEGEAGGRRWDTVLRRGKEGDMEDNGKINHTVRDKVNSLLFKNDNCF